MPRKREKLRGIYEDPKGSNIWWIQYFDLQRKRHREKVGRREAAINLLAIRRSEKIEGRKLPPPRQAVLFRALCADALEHSRAENTSKSTHELGCINHLLPVFGDRVAEEITKQEIVRWLTDQSGSAAGSRPVAIAGRRLSRSFFAWGLIMKRSRETRRPG